MSFRSNFETKKMIAFVAVDLKSIVDFVGWTSLFREIGTSQESV